MCKWTKSPGSPVCLIVCVDFHISTSYFPANSPKHVSRWIGYSHSKRVCVHGALWWVPLRGYPSLAPNVPDIGNRYTITLTKIKWLLKITKWMKKEGESPRVASAKPPKFMNAMEIKWNYTTSEQLTTALLCSSALDSGIPGRYHVIQTGYPFVCGNWHLFSFP